MRLFSVSASVTAIALAAASGAASPEIGPGAFSPGATLIDFDDLTGGSTIFTGDIVTTQYVGLGAEFVNPDFVSRANANLAALYGTQSDPNLLFIHQGGGREPGARPQEIHFSMPVTKVGMWFGTSNGATVTLEVYDGIGLLESLTKRGDPAGAFGLEGFIGLERSEQITMVRLFSTSDDPTLGPFNFSIDDLLFEGDSVCYADCDESGDLDFFDFLCFQNAFAAGEPYADCDESGTLDFFDFLCFQNAFAAGCP